jgi:hypothetical protein
MCLQCPHKLITCTFVLYITSRHCTDTTYNAEIIWNQLIIPKAFVTNSSNNPRSITSNINFGSFLSFTPNPEGSDKNGFQYLDFSVLVQTRPSSSGAPYRARDKSGRKWPGWSTLFAPYRYSLSNNQIIR